MANQSQNPLNDLTELAKNLKPKVEQQPVTVKNELVKLLRPAIKFGQNQGRSTKPEKRFYKKLKAVDAEEQPDKLKRAIDEWVEERAQ